MNTELLLRIREHILEEPLRFDMHDWVSEGVDLRLYPVAPPCGTVACIAGWATKLGDRKVEDTAAYAAVAQELLGLSTAQADALFYVSHWPAKFRDDYIAAEWGTRDYVEQRRRVAEIAAARIDHMIKTGL